MYLIYYNNQVIFQFPGDGSEDAVSFGEMKRQIRQYAGPYKITIFKRQRYLNIGLYTAINDETDHIIFKVMVYKDRIVIDDFSLV